MLSLQECGPIMGLNTAGTLGSGRIQQLGVRCPVHCTSVQEADSYRKHRWPVCIKSHRHLAVSASEYILKDLTASLSRVGSRCLNTEGCGRTLHIESTTVSEPCQKMRRQGTMTVVSVCSQAMEENKMESFS